MIRCTLVFLVLEILCCSATFGIFVRPEMIPTERLLKNTGAFLAKHPRDAAAHYTLGRIHYLAFVLGLDRLPAHRGGENELPKIANDELIGEPVAAMRQERAEELARAEFKLKPGALPDGDAERSRYFAAISRHQQELHESNWRPEKLSTEALLEHAVQARQAMDRALEIEPDNGLFHLGLASLLTQVADWNEEAKVDPLPPALRGGLRTQARAEFLLAWTKSYPADSKATHLPLLGLNEFVSYEAGQAFVRLAEQPAAKLSPGETAALARIQAAIDQQEKLPVGPITPMIVPLRPTGSIEELLAPNHLVEFDLRGFGVPELWSWLQPEAGLLVWDPEDQRDIRSGRQLFGSYTFQIFWPTGYDALAALDDNADGQLTGSELDGIGVWFDRNGDAVSSRDEVTPIKELGIRALATKTTGRDGSHPTNPHGVTNRDGRTTPSWDWITTPASSVAP
ncbi:MAG: hypothetical protein ABI680_10140 [Chthoniobacteraceae bacterium]